MRHRASPSFWKLYDALPAAVQRVADKNYELLQADPRHSSLHFKKVEGLWSVRVGAHYRALGFDHENGVMWFWIGSHAEYDKFMP